MRYIFYLEFIAVFFFLKQLFIDLKFLFNSNIIYGEIVDINKKVSKGKDAFFPVIKVTDKEDNTYSYTPAIGSSHRLRIGKIIKMRKLSDKKKIQIKHNNFFNLFFKSIYVFIVGLIFLLILVVIDSILTYYGYN